MASPPPVVLEEKEKGVAAPKNAALGEGAGATVRRRPGRLRVVHPDVAELLRSPRRRVRAKTPAALGAPPVRYDCTFEDDEEGARGLAPPRLVWCKVRCHPWWPGQVVGPADASELAQRQRRGRSAALVAFFWDKTFAWAADPAALLPFRAGFRRLAAQNAMPTFAAAVDDALGEVARRVDAGLSCGCAAATKKHAIDNAGVREGADAAAPDAAFARGALRGEAFVAYISALATAPLAGADRVDLAVATAQLKAFSRWRGPRGGLPEYTFFHGIDGVPLEAHATVKAKRGRSRADDVIEKWKMSRCRGRGNAPNSEGADDAMELDDLEIPPQPTPYQMSTRIGELMSRAAQHMSRSPVIAGAHGSAPPTVVSHMSGCTRVADGCPPVSNGGDLRDDHTCKVPQVNGRRPDGEMERPLQAGLMLNFSSAGAVPSTSELAMIFSRFGPIEEVKVENSAAVVIFKRREHAEDAFSGTAKISAISVFLSSFRVISPLPGERVQLFSFA
ncbi:hypothetical protein ACP4OV_016534 [Aristida adscensionis]